MSNAISQSTHARFDPHPAEAEPTTVRARAVPAAAPGPSRERDEIQHSTGSRNLVERFSPRRAAAATAPPSVAATRSAAADPGAARARAAVESFASAVPGHGVDLDTLMAEVSAQAPPNTTVRQLELRATQAFVRQALANDPRLADRALSARMCGLPSSDRAAVRAALAHDARTGIYRYAEGERILTRLSAAAPGDRATIRASAGAEACFGAAVEEASTAGGAAMAPHLDATSAWPDFHGPRADVTRDGARTSVSLSAIGGEWHGEVPGVASASVEGELVYFEASMGPAGGSIEAGLLRGHQDRTVLGVRTASELEILSVRGGLYDGDEVHGERRTGIAATASVAEAKVTLGGEDDHLSLSAGVGGGFKAEFRSQDRDGDGRTAECVEVAVGHPVDLGVGYCAEPQATVPAPAPNPGQGASGAGNADLAGAGGTAAY